MTAEQRIRAAEQACRPLFERVDAIEEANTRRVLVAFGEHRVGVRHFAGSEGYGYGDDGRDTLEKMVARLFGVPAAIFRPQIASGTHALSLGLFGLLQPGDHLISAMGHPYDTLLDVIGVHGPAPGSLREMGVTYAMVPPTGEGKLDIPGVLSAITPGTRVILVQRSRGYSWRDALTPQDMAPLFEAVKKARPDIYLYVDNCYGAFVTRDEPTHYGADVAVGSLIKNLGGGIAPTGGYLVGSEEAIRRIAHRLTAPGLGLEVGSYAPGYRLFYQGLFLAPHTVAQAVKAAVLAARVFEDLGYEVSPSWQAPRGDVIQAIRFGAPEPLTAFVQAIQANSPVDSYAAPEPWDMPGYADPVIMAAGTFVPGASIELSCDAPIRPPYTAYLQGALTYAHGKAALEKAVEGISLALR